MDEFAVTEDSIVKLECPGLTVPGDFGGINQTQGKITRKTPPFRFYCIQHHRMIRIHAIDSIHIVRVSSTLSTRSTSSGSNRIHAIDSIHIVRVLSHPRYRLDPHRPGLIASTLSTRSTSSGSYRIHAIDSIHIVWVLSHPRYRLDPHRPGFGFRV